MLVLAGTTGLGGGFLRDVLIGADAAGGAGGLALPAGAGRRRAGDLLLPPGAGRRAERVINVFDAAGLALFCVTGALKALDYGLGPVPAALMGMVTGIGGGIARDVLAGRVPRCSAASSTPPRRWPARRRGAGRAGVTGHLAGRGAGRGDLLRLAAARDPAQLAGARCRRGRPASSTG